MHPTPIERDEIYQVLTQIFRDVFEDDRITLTAATTAADIPAWDSVSHISLVISVEQRFGVKFNVAEVARMANVGEFADAILNKQDLNGNRA